MMPDSRKSTESSELMRRLEAGELLLVFIHPESIQDPAALARALESLDDEERERQARFVFPKHRHDFLVAHGFVREVLSLVLGDSAASWRFEKNARGRPDVVLGPGHPPLVFNLSHTDGLAACLIGLAREPGFALGVDVEVLSRKTAGSRIAERYFAPSELADFLALPDAQRVTRFYDLWTLKEAWMKARGEGLALGLKTFSYHLRPDEAIGIEIEDSIRMDGPPWHFRLLDPPGTDGEPDRGRRAAIAVRTEPFAGLSTFVSRLTGGLVEVPAKVRNHATRPD